MDESTKKAIEGIEKQYAAMAKAMEPTPAMKKLMEDVSKSMAQLPSFSLPDVALTPPAIPRMATQAEINNYQSASALMEALADEALRWREHLSEKYKPAILAVLYGGIQIHVNSLSQVSFHGIQIEGTLNGAPCSVLAHQSTVQLLCFAEEVKADSPRQPIGFVWDDNRIEV